MTRRSIFIGCGAVVALGVLVFVALLVGVVIGGRGSGKQPTPEPGSTSAESEKDSTPKNVTSPNNVDVVVGETAELRDRTLLVYEVERDYFPARSRSARRPQPENEFVRVYIVLRNNGNQSFDYNPTKFMIQDSNGVQHRGQALTELPYPIRSGSLASGGMLEGNLVFEVPRGDSGLSMLYEPFERNVETVTVAL